MSQVCKVSAMPDSMEGWAKEKGIQVGEVKCLESSDLRGIQAASSISPGQTLFSVPMSSAILLSAARKRYVEMRRQHYPRHVTNHSASVFVLLSDPWLVFRKILRIPLCSLPWRAQINLLLTPMPGHPQNHAGTTVRPHLSTPVNTLSHCGARLHSIVLLQNHKNNSMFEQHSSIRIPCSCMLEQHNSDFKAAAGSVTFCHRYSCISFERVHGICVVFAYSKHLLKTIEPRHLWVESHILVRI